MDGLPKAIRTIALLVVVTMGLLITACYGVISQTGILEGNVTSGPIWPVEQPGGNPPVPPEVFEARKILVYNKDRAELIETVDLRQIDQGQVGYYSVQMKPGTYVVDINRVGMDSSSDVPKNVEIRPGETVEVNIDIDTGIR